MIRALALLLVLTVFAISMPLPWGALWLGVPIAVVLALLVSWRWGPWGVAVPVALMATGMLAVDPLAPWMWWVPVAALSGSWMGLKEEGGGPPAGRRAWMLLPLLLLAAGLGWTVSYPDLVSRVEGQMRSGDEQLLRLSREAGYQGDRLQWLEHRVSDSAALRQRALPNLLPSLLFVWMAMLVIEPNNVSSSLACAVMLTSKPSMRAASVRASAIRLCAW